MQGGAMINFTNRTSFFIGAAPTDMRKGRNCLAEEIRSCLGQDPYCHNNAYIFYSKDYRKI